jgi:hypothetical protein
MGISGFEIPTFVKSFTSRNFLKIFQGGSSLFCDVRQHRLVVVSRRLGTTFKGQPRPLKMGQLFVWKHQQITSNLRCLTSQKKKISFRPLRRPKITHNLKCLNK